MWPSCSETSVRAFKFWWMGRWVPRRFARSGFRLQVLTPSREKRAWVTLSSRPHLLREADATEQCIKARIGMQRIEPWLNVEITQSERMLLICLIQVR
jgi:hypothetical protein